MTVELTLNETSLMDDRATSWSAVTCLSLLTFLLVGLEFLPVSLLTPIARDLSISEGQAGLAITVSGVFAVLTSLFGNAFLARIDRKSVVLLYTAVLVASSLAVALAPNFPVFLVGRSLVGVSIGGFWSLSTAILARLVSDRDLPKAIALLQGGTAFALVLAAPLGSFLGGFIGWRGTFFITVPIGIAALVWQLVVLPRMLSDINRLGGQNIRAAAQSHIRSWNGGDRLGLHWPERTVHLSSPVPRRRHGTGIECSVHGASRPRSRRASWNLRDRLRRPAPPPTRSRRSARLLLLSLPCC